jgi:hypothetical protein
MVWHSSDEATISERISKLQDQLHGWDYSCSCFFLGRGRSSQMLSGQAEAGDRPGQC